MSVWKELDSLWSVDIHRFLSLEEENNILLLTQTAHGKQENPAVFDTQLDPRSNLT